MKHFKVLYVDSDTISLLLFSLMFKGYCDIFTANTAEVALDILESNTEIEILVTEMEVVDANVFDMILKVKKKRI